MLTNAGQSGSIGPNLPDSDLARKVRSLARSRAASQELFVLPQVMLEYETSPGVPSLKSMA
jgi:hypothetical protein